MLGAWVEMTQRTRATKTVDKSTYIWPFPVAWDFQSMGSQWQRPMRKHPESSHPR